MNDWKRKLYYTLHSGKNPKFIYYLVNYIRQAVPKPLLHALFDRELRKLDRRNDREYIMHRVDYYCQLAANTPYDREAFLKASTQLRHTRKTGASVYYYDALEFSRWFDQSLRWILQAGDIDYDLPLPSIVKSRLIAGNKVNNTIMKLEKVRHFIFVNDPLSFSEKKDMAIFRGKIGQAQADRIEVKQNRYDFARQFFGHPMVDVGEIGGAFPEWRTEKMTISEHLDYKFIMSLEGNDVASNLKWIMSSNSLAVSPPLRCETWFMEGTLKPDYHYLGVEDNYSDLLSKMEYYIAHPEEAQHIIDHAHQYIDQFRDREREKLISLLVLKRYLDIMNPL